MTLITQLILLALGVALLLWVAKRDTIYSSEEAAEHGPSPPYGPDGYGMVHLAENDGHPLTALTRFGDRESACDQSMARTGKTAERGDVCLAPECTERTARVEPA